MRSWVVPTDGFRVVRARPVASRGAREALADYLVATATAPSAGRSYELSDRLLCRAFAELGDASSVVAFADRHGWLGVGRRFVVPRDPTSEHVLEGEPIAFWREQAAAMRFALELVDVSLEREDEVSPFSRRSARRFDFRWSRGDVVLLDSGVPIERVDAGDAVGPYVLKGDARRAALLFAQRAINRALDQLTAMRLAFDARTGALALLPQGEGLLGKLWLQVAELAEGKFQHRECGGCGKWFAIERGKDRRDSRYCPSGVRVFVSGRKDARSMQCRDKRRAWREKKAKEYLTRGDRVASVARTLQMKVETVERLARTVRERRRRR